MLNWKRMLRSNFCLNFEQIYEEAKTAQVAEKLEDELASFAELISQQYEFKIFLEDPRILAKLKKQRLRELAAPGMTSNFFAVIDMLIDFGREELVAEVASQFTREFSKELGVLFGRVSSVVSISSEGQKKLASVMAKIENRPIHLRYSNDGTLLGGFFIRLINGRVWDLSLRGKLNELKTVLFEK